MITRILWKLIEKPLIEVVREHEADEKKWMNEEVWPKMTEGIDDLLVKQEDNIQLILKNFEKTQREWIEQAINPILKQFNEKLQQLEADIAAFKQIENKITDITYKRFNPDIVNLNFNPEITAEERANLSAQEAVDLFDKI